MQVAIVVSIYDRFVLLTSKQEGFSYLFNSSVIELYTNAHLVSCKVSKYGDGFN